MSKRVRFSKGCLEVDGESLTLGDEVKLPEDIQLNEKLLAQRPFFHNWRMASTRSFAEVEIEVCWTFKLWGHKGQIAPVLKTESEWFRWGEVTPLGG